MRVLMFVSLFAASLVFVAGCGGKSAPAGGASDGKEPAGGDPAAGKVRKVPTEVTLTDGGVADIDRAAKDTEKAVVLVEFWTMATEPSADLGLVSNTRGGDGQTRGQTLGKDKVAWHGVRKAEFLGMRYGDHLLRVILVNVDGPEKKDEVLKFLKDHEALHVTNFVWKDAPGAAAERYGFTGKAPHQAVFGRNGKRVWATGEPMPGPGSFDSLIFVELDK
jgi:hypothetical protein